MRCSFSLLVFFPPGPGKMATEVHSPLEERRCPPSLGLLQSHQPCLLPDSQSSRLSPLDCQFFMVRIEDGGPFQGYFESLRAGVVEDGPRWDSFPTCSQPCLLDGSGVT
jgi:hypothetical protein